MLAFITLDLGQKAEKQSILVLIISHPNGRDFFHTRQTNVTKANLEMKQNTWLTAIINFILLSWLSKESQESLLQLFHSMLIMDIRRPKVSCETLLSTQSKRATFTLGKNVLLIQLIIRQLKHVQQCFSSFPIDLSLLQCQQRHKSNFTVPPNLQRGHQKPGALFLQFMPNTKDPNVWLKIRENPEQSVLKQITTTKIKYVVVCDAGLDYQENQMNRVDFQLLETYHL